MTIQSTGHGTQVTIKACVSIFFRILQRSATGYIVYHESVSETFEARLGFYNIKLNKNIQHILLWSNNVNFKILKREKYFDNKAYII